MTTRTKPLRATDPGVISVAFPLRGEWRAPNTPAHRVPSHGSHLWAQTYAYDLWRTRPDRPGGFHCRGNLRYWTRGVRLADCPGYGQPIHSAFGGTVVRAGDGIVDRDHLHPVLDLLRVVRNSLSLRASAEPWAMIGNHVVVAHDELDDCFALYAHLAHGSLEVECGDHVATGSLLARVGHTGNSTAPHLHFQLMTTPDPTAAEAIPCAFSGLDEHREGSWVRSNRAVPGLHDRVRGLGDRTRTATIDG